MTDHVTRMVQGWLEKSAGRAVERQAVSSLVDSIHRMIREAERETQLRCAEVARQAAVLPPSEIATAIQTLRPKHDGS
jgi:hypothetical protein